MRAGLHRVRDRPAWDENLQETAFAHYDSAAEGERAITEYERVAFEVLTRHGLPGARGRYKAAGGGWVVAEPSPEDPNGIGEPVEALALRYHARDSEVGFAVAILTQAKRARQVVEHGDAANGLMAGLNLRLTFDAWWEEFGLADLIAPARRSKEGARDGGSARAQGASARHAAWQDAAERIWTRNPALSKESVGEMVAKRLGGVKPRTVSRSIKKPVRTGAP